MKVGGQILWNVTPICETSQIYYLMGRRPMKNVLGNHLKDPLFHVETMDALETTQKRLNAKEVIFSKQGEFIFPITDGRFFLRQS